MKIRVFRHSLAVAVASGMILACGAELVRVSERFGYDPVDATANLQAALDSELPEIVGNGAVMRMWREDYAHGKDGTGTSGGCASCRKAASSRSRAFPASDFGR